MLRYGWGIVVVLFGSDVMVFSVENLNLLEKVCDFCVCFVLLVFVVFLDVFLVVVLGFNLWIFKWNDVILCLGVWLLLVFVYSVIMILGVVVIVMLVMVVLGLIVCKI